jgi:hypothetical protein
MRVAMPGGPIQVARVALTSAQIKALDLTAVTLIPAPGANRAILVVGGSLEAIFGTRAYAPIGSGFSITYGGIAPAVATDIVRAPDAGASALLTAAASVWAPFGTAAADLYSLANFLPAALALIRSQAVTLVAAAGAGYGNGPIATATIGAPGLGYALNDTGVIDPAFAVSTGDATYLITSVGALGVVTGFTVSAPGTAYPVANGIATGTGGGQPGVGTGFTANVTSVAAGDGTLVATLYYAIVNL